MILILLTNVVVAIAILVAAWVGGNFVQKTIKNVKRLDNTLRSFLGGMAKYAILVVAAVMTLNQFGVQTASLIAVLGAAGLAIGLALQGTLSNVASGVMLLVLRPFNVGDFIQFNGHSGIVKSLGLFGTELATLDNVYIYAPNSSIWNSDIYNYSRNPMRRQDLIFGISYGDDINKAFKTIQKVLDKEDRVLKEGDQAPLIAVSALGDSSVDILVRVWSAADHFNVKLDVIKAIKEALDKDGITIPFPTRTIEMSSPVSEPAAAKPVKKVPASKTKKAA